METSGDSSAQLPRLLQEESKLSQQLRTLESRKIEWQVQLQKLHDKSIARGREWSKKTSLHSQQIFRGIQKADEQKTRVDNLNLIVQSLINLKTALECLHADIKNTKSDIGKSCETFGRILVQLKDETLLERAWNSRNHNKSGTILSETLDGMRLQLKERLVHYLSQLAFTNDMDGAMLRAFEYFRLLQLIGADDEASSQMRSTLHQVCSSSLQAIVDSSLGNIDFTHSIKMGKCIEYAMGFANWCHRRISLTPFVDSQAISLIVDEVILRQDLSTTIISIIKAFLDQARIKDFAVNREKSPGAPMDIREMDLIVAEMALIIQHASTWQIESSSLDNILSELGQIYVVLEGKYLRLGVKKALEMNELKRDSSTAIEDTLFLLQKCIERSRGVQSDAPSKIIAEAKSALKSELLACLMRRTKVELKAPDNLYLVANDCLGAVKLIDSLIEDNYQVSADFVDVKESFEGCRKVCLESIYGKDIKTKSPLANLPRELASFMMLPAQSNEQEMSQCPLHNLILWWKQQQQPELTYLNILWPQNVKSLIELYLQDCANIIARTITNYSTNPSVAHQRWLDLERDIRKIIIFFNEPTEYSAKLCFEKVLGLLAGLIE